jgi:hypothetical protein
VPHDRLVVVEDGRELSFAFDDLLAYHGGNSPGGVAHAFKVMERAFPLLDSAGQIERRELVLDTAFGGPGARDAFELVTRAVTDGRFTHDPSLARPELGVARERFVFRLSYRERQAVLTVREGFVTEEFVALTRKPNRTAAEEGQLATMKSEMAALVMSVPADSVYDADGPRPSSSSSS